MHKVFPYQRRFAFCGLLAMGGFLACPSWGYQLTPIYNFTGGSDGMQVAGDLTIDSSGDIYATSQALFDNPTNTGGGAIVEIMAGTHVGNVVVNFPSNAPGALNIPAGPFILDQSGNLTGLTVYGGTNNDGVLFKVASGSHSATTLASFNGPTTGANPFDSGLVSDSLGNFYGATDYGGQGYTTIDTGDGTLFKVAAGTSTISTLVTFNGNDGAIPVGKLLVTSDGTIYGATREGGTSNDGTVYKLSPGSTTPQTIATFNGSNGAYPAGGVIEDSHGNLYGMTTGTLEGYSGPGGVGSVYEIQAGTGQVIPLATFDTTNGANPLNELYIDSNGNLFGTTNFGGTNNLGTVFEISAQTQKLATIWSFSGSDGDFPASSLIADAQGNIYGAASHGGLYDDGDVFELTVPEPASLTMLLAATSILAFRRRSCRLDTVHAALK
ncbi:MAG TPA: choice-of-anchor tandem repeat GloVer-containing protein [Tepidisphaeraceae bacterium]|jgi:uncharacterized repeat protein (TIGR03803 family)